MLDFSITDETEIENFLNAPCCESLVKSQCSTHFLTPELINQLRAKLNEDHTPTVAKIIAELAKNQQCREYLTDAFLIEKLVKNLKSSDQEFLLQSLRALANLCYEHDPAAVVVAQKGALDLLNNLLVEYTCKNDTENQIIFAVCGVLCNLVTNDCSDVNFLPEALRNRLLDLMRNELAVGKVTLVSYRLMTVFVNLASCTEDDSVFSPTVCRLAVDLLKVSEDETFYNAALEYLADSSLTDDVKLRLAEAGLCDFLVRHVDELALEEINEKEWEIIGRVMTNILAGGDSLRYITANSCPKLLDRIAEWITYDEYNHTVLAARCLANYACSEANSLEIVERGLHKPLLVAILKEDCPRLMQHAVLSTFQNISIPKSNKQRLIADGILEALEPFHSLDIPSAPQLICQLLNIWRKLSGDSPKTAMVLGLNNELVAQIATWGKEDWPWIMYESPRLLCTIICKTKERQVALNFLFNNAYSVIIKLLGVKDEVMLIEAVNALAVAAMLFLETQPAWETNVLEAGIIEAIENLLPLVQNVQLMENIITLLEFLYKYEGIRTSLMEAKVLPKLLEIILMNAQFKKLLQRVAKLHGCK